MFGLNKYDSLKLRIELLETELKILRETRVLNKEPVYTQYDFNKSSINDNKHSFNYILPYTKVEYTFTELVELLLRHTGMQLSKEITPAKTEIKLTKVKKVK